MAIVTSVIGWFIVYVISTRALKRADITKAKDSCIKIIEDTIDFVDEVDKDTLDSGKLSELYIESKLTIYATRLELKIMNLNGLTSFELICPTTFPFILRSVDSDELIKKQSERIELQEKLLDAIESTEDKYRNCFFTANFVQRILIYRKPELYGALTALSVLFVAALLLKAIGL